MPAIHQGAVQLLECLPTYPHPDIEPVLETMSKIEAALPAAGLDHVAPFNAVYSELTQSVLDNVGRPGVFNQPETVRRTVGIFADLYFQPLRAYAEGKQYLIPHSWKALIAHVEPQNTPPGIQFLIGMNAHINYDLPQALCSSKVNQEYYEDYRTVIGSLIDATARKLAVDYVPLPVVTRGMATKIAVHRIAAWRERAWKAGHTLQQLHAKPLETFNLKERLDARALRTARWIAPLGSTVLRYSSLKSPV